MDEAPQRAPAPQQYLRWSGILAILSCTGCSKKLRVPDGRRGTVTCPHCRAEWFHPETIELSEVEFRCSKSGARFNVISSRRSPLHKFIIQAIDKPTPKANQAPQTDSPSSSPQLAVKATPALPGARPKRAGWLARIVGRKVKVVSPKSSGDASNGQAPDPASAVAVHDADEYNWSGFSCPFCDATSFVSSVGGHLACDGTAQIRIGGRFHQCFCGQAGMITGSIKSLESRRISVESEVCPTDDPRAERRQQKDNELPDVMLPLPQTVPFTKR
jgi:hypothetical protein